MARRRCSLMGYRWFMSEDQLIDYEAARKRFPWMGLVSVETTAVAARYREIMTRARLDRDAAEAMEAVQRSA